LFAPLSDTGNRQAPQKIYSTPVPARSSARCTLARLTAMDGQRPIPMILSPAGSWHARLSRQSASLDDHRHDPALSL
jgi:hypothetical protein